MTECRRCGESYTPKDGFKVCQECQSRILEDFRQEIEYTQQTSKKATFKLRPGWKAKCYNTGTRLEEAADFLHIDIKYQGLTFEINIKKHDADNKFFQVWLGDKQFILKPNDGNFKVGDQYDGHGEIVKEVPYKQVDVDVPKET